MKIMNRGFKNPFELNPGTIKINDLEFRIYYNELNVT